MDFEVQNITVYSTRHYDNPQAALDEANYHCKDILDKLSGRSDYLYYDENNDQDAVKSFKDWMCEIASSLNDFQTCDLLSVKERDIIVYLWGDDVKSRFIPPNKSRRQDA